MVAWACASAARKEKRTPAGLRGVNLPAAMDKSVNRKKKTQTQPNFIEKREQLT
jgi:hypothetical protein